MKKWHRLSSCSLISHVNFLRHNLCRASSRNFTTTKTSNILTLHTTDMASRVISNRCLHLTHSPPAARAFLALAAQQMSRRGNFSTSSQAQQPQQALLDFLVPSIRIPSPRKSLQSTPLKSLETRSRPFSSSTRRSQTEAIFNPQKDDDGKEMLVEITTRAANVCSPLTCCYI